MSTSPDIWMAFARSFSMLFVVLALLLLVFYLIKRVSDHKGVKGQKNFIKILAVHHLSPKEKLVLVDVLGDSLLIGVTPSQISKITSIDKEIDLSDPPEKELFSFSDLLSGKLGRSLKPPVAKKEKQGEPA